MERYFTGLVLALAMLVAGCAGTQEAMQMQYNDDLMGALAASPNMDTFAEMVMTAGMADELDGPEDYTLFVPTDAAFERFPDDLRAELLEPGNRDRLEALVEAHIVKGEYSADDLLTGYSTVGPDSGLETLNGDRVQVRAGELEGLLIGNAAVVQPDIETLNGVIHAVDKVILPEGLDDLVNR